MDLEKILELMSEMQSCGMKLVAIKDENGYEVELERESNVELAPYHSSEERRDVQQPSISTLLKEKEQLTTSESEQPKEIEIKEKYHITSPMVGTFYSSPTPDDEVFIKVGDTVTEESVVCIIEAMKVMNEVKAGKSGTISAIYVDNASPVEFGTKLFEIV